VRDTELQKPKAPFWKGKSMDANQTLEAEIIEVETAKCPGVPHRGHTYANEPCPETDEIPRKVYLTCSNEYQRMDEAGKLRGPVKHYMVAIREDGCFLGGLEVTHEADGTRILSGYEHEYDLDRSIRFTSQLPLELRLATHHYGRWSGDLK